MISRYISLIMERLSAIDWRTALLTISVICVGVLIFQSVAYVVRLVKELVRTWRMLYLVAELERQVKSLRQQFERIELQFSTDINTREHNMMICPPPLPQGNPTVDATDWIDDFRKTEIITDPCFPLSKP